MKTTKSRMKKTLFLALSAVAAISIGAGVGSIYANAETNDATKLESMKTGGASIRLSGNWGIRFQTTLDKTDYADLTADGSGLVTGVLAIPADMLEDKEQLTLANTDAANAVTYNGTVNEWVQSKDDETLMEAYAYLDGNDIPELSYTRNISFRGYYTYNGNTVYMDVNNRSMTYVAQAALEHDEKTTNENAAEKDKVLDDTAETKAKSFVKDYTVAYVDGVTGKLISTDTVSASGNVADNKVEENPADPTLFGGEFAGWTCQNEEWMGTEEKLTGDTVVKANYTAATTLDFSTATEVPTHLVSSMKNGTAIGCLNIQDNALYNETWSDFTFKIAFLEEMVLSQYDRIIVEVKAVNSGKNWFKILLDDEAATRIYWNASVDSADNNDYITIEYTAGENGLSFQTLQFTNDNANSIYKYYIRSIKIERVDWDNINFETYNAMPDYWYVNGSGYSKDIAEDVIGTADDGSEIKAKALKVSNLPNGGYIEIRYPSIQLNVGDKIVVKLSFVGNSASGLEVNVNGTWNGENNKSATTGKDTSGYVDCTINIENACVLETLKIRPWGSATTLNVVSVIIERA